MTRGLDRNAPMPVPPQRLCALGASFSRLEKRATPPGDDPVRQLVSTASERPTSSFRDKRKRPDLLEDRDVFAVPPQGLEP